MKMIRSVTTVALCSTLLAGAASAGGHGNHGNNFYINPAVGYQFFDGDSGLDDEALLSLGLEYRFNEKWGAEIKAMDSSPELSNGLADLDYRQYGISALRYLESDEKFAPYLALGLGRARAELSGASASETQVDLGVGFRYFLSNHWAVKGDAKLIHTDEGSTLDQLFSLGISYAFKGNYAAPAKPVEPVDGDADGDGVKDSVDQCPTTPAGVAVDASGCALDSDGDGVADYKDQCPDTPAGREVDENGCKFVLKSTEEISLRVNFASNSDVVTEDYFAEIQRVADFMKKYASVSATIEGHTDNTGSASYNESLSQRRADAVMKVLVERFGIDASRVSAVGYGQVRPIETNDTQAGRLANRRVVAVMKAEIEE